MDIIHGVHCCAKVAAGFRKDEVLGWNNTTGVGTIELAMWHSRQRMVGLEDAVRRRGAYLSCSMHMMPPV